MPDQDAPIGVHGAVHRGRRETGHTTPALRAGLHCPALPRRINSLPV